jgi:signal transduction histidine kinase
VVAWLSLDFRARVRTQVLKREGESLQDVALMQRASAADRYLNMGLPAVIDPLETALETSKLRGVVAIRIFDAQGVFIDAVPAATDEAGLDPADRESLARNQPVTRFHPEYALEELLLTAAPAARATLLEVNAPLPPHGTDPSGHVLQYWIDGSAVAAEFAHYDTRLAQLAGWAFIVGGALIVGAIWWAIRRLGQANALLRARAEDLDRANRELAQTVRTSAIGAITAHLMHGLRNPLAGLEDFVAGQGATTDSAAGEWAAARESARRMRTMINDVHAVLRDVEHGADYILTTGEICAGLRERLQSCCARHGVQLACGGDEQATVAAREAGLGGLVLANLAQNAIEASSRGAVVGVTAAVVERAVIFRVRDQGPGLAPEIATDPFRPRRSSKPDGAGIGLAISRELARHAGGELRLVHSGPDGTCFEVTLPTVVAEPSRKPA